MVVYTVDLFKKAKTMRVLIVLTSLLLLASPVLALDFDQNVTPDVIFGSGNLNGSFTTDTAGGVELGLRGKLRFDDMNQPQNVFNSGGDGTYFFVAGAAPSGFGWLPGSPTTPIWNFEFSVNTDVEGTGGLNIDDFTYELGLDFDPDPASAVYLIFDPITPSAAAPYADHSLGDNTTTYLTDFVAGDEATYAAYLASLNVAQNSWSYEFFNDAPYDTFDPSQDAVYEIYLRAYDLGGTLVAETAISIVVGNAVSNQASSWSEVKALFR